MHVLAVEGETEADVVLQGPKLPQNEDRDSRRGNLQQETVARLELAYSHNSTAASMYRP